MGGSSWSSQVYDDRVSSRLATGTPVFKHTAAVNSGAAARAAHADLDPKKVAGPSSPLAGKVVRESRDSDAHPESLPIAVFFDVTGSMGSIPAALEKKLAGLMALLVGKNYVRDPQVLFGAIGDAYSDHAPLQVGQFESGIEMDDVLEQIWLEGNGGGQRSESYQLAHYYALHHFASDAWDKRGVKGYLFTMGDENFYPTIEPRQVKDLIGDAIEPTSTDQVVRALSERWHVFHIIVEQGGYPHDPVIEGAWKALLGERVLKLEDHANVAELIALTIGLNEGTLDAGSIADDLRDAGLDARASASLSTSLVPVSKGAGLQRATVTGDLPVAAGASGVMRL